MRHTTAAQRFLLVPAACDARDALLAPEWCILPALALQPSLLGNQQAMSACASGDKWHVETKTWG